MDQPRPVRHPQNDREHFRRGMASNNLKRGPGGDTTSRQSAELRRSRKIFSTFLIDFYEAHPARKKKLMMKAIEYAEKGSARFLELIITLVEGPLKGEPTGDTYNFNFLSEGDRRRAIESVERIKALAESIPVLPEKTNEDS